MNSLGRIFRVSVFGESHGDGAGVLIDGCPAGIDFPLDFVKEELQRRRPGAVGTTARCEQDIPIIKSGIFEGKTTGAPILIFFENKDVQSHLYNPDIPRPGHADMTAQQKYHGYNDYRGGGHFSGRLTVGLVAAGALAKTILSSVVIEAKIDSIAGHKEGFNKIILKAQQDGDSVGGIIECCVKGLPVGLGEPFFDSTESLISHAIFSIPGIKAIEFGAGFRCSEMLGSEYNDSIVGCKGSMSTNYSGGINGGISNGNDIVFRVAVRPTPSIAKNQDTINLKTGHKTVLSTSGRHDSCIVVRMPVIVEAVTAIVLADLMRTDGFNRHS
jgi:chorismate synthase